MKPTTKKGNGKRSRPRPIPKVLTGAELDRLWMAMEKDTPTKLRNLCMVKMGANCGLRSQEIVDLRYGDIEWESGKLVVKGKCGKERVLWISDADLALLQELIEVNPTSKTGAWLFVTASGRKVDTRFMRAMLEWLGRKIGRHIAPHGLRHTFAVDLLQRTKNIYLVQQALGHSSISTTQVYLSLVPGELSEGMRGLRP